MGIGQIRRGIMNIVVGQLAGDCLHLTHRIISPAAITPLLELIDDINIALLSDHGIDRRSAATAVIMAGLTCGNARAFAAQLLGKTVVAHRTAIFDQRPAFIRFTHFYTRLLERRQIRTFEMNGLTRQEGGHIPTIFGGEALGIGVHDEHRGIGTAIGGEVFELLHLESVMLTRDTRRTLIVVSGTIFTVAAVARRNVALALLENLFSIGGVAFSLRDIALRRLRAERSQSN